MDFFVAHSHAASSQPFGLTSIGCSPAVSSSRRAVSGRAMNAAAPYSLMETSTMSFRFYLAWCVAWAMAFVPSASFGQIDMRSKVALGTKVIWKDQAAPVTNGNQFVCTCGDLHWPCVVEKATGPHSCGSATPSFMDGSTAIRS